MSACPHIPASPPELGDPDRPRVLVVDDDPTARCILCNALARNFNVRLAQDVREAQREVLAAGAGAYDCVVTDYHLPGSSGLDLLSWIKRNEPGLGTVMVTGLGEKELIKESLRQGAVDFLEKPAAPAKLREAVRRATAHTARQRSLAESETAVKSLGTAQEWMLHSAPSETGAQTDVFFHPKHAAGGDFFTRIDPSPGRMFCLLTDVSGHDVQAAYISAYFQGLVRGMLEERARVGEIFSKINRLLYDEWNTPGKARGGASVAACAVLVDFDAEEATVVSHGMPAAVYWHPKFQPIALGQNGGHPLGWFHEFTPLGVSHSVCERGAFSLWTDGLDDLARKLGVSQLGFASALRQAKAGQRKMPELHLAEDDILLTDIHLSQVTAAPDAAHPLILDEYHGGQADEIDRLQARWERSVRFAAPEIPAQTLHDFLLASREAVLNALVHGCQRRADLRSVFHVSYSPVLRNLSATVHDPGAGHDFDVDAHEATAAKELHTHHWGLILLRRLAHKTSFERNGALVSMDFTWL